MKLSAFIAELEKLHAANGDLDVYVSQDDEGNGYGTVNSDDIGYSDSYLCIYPGYPRLDDLPGCEEDDE